MRSNGWTSSKIAVAAAFLAVALSACTDGDPLVPEAEEPDNYEALEQLEQRAGEASEH